MLKFYIHKVRCREIESIQHHTNVKTEKSFSSRVECHSLEDDGGKTRPVTAYWFAHEYLLPSSTVNSQ